MSNALSIAENFIVLDPGLNCDLVAASDSLYPEMMLATDSGDTAVRLESPGSRPGAYPGHG